MEAQEVKKKLLLAALLAVMADSASAACTFRWSHYGENPIRDLVAKQIGSYVTDKYCQKFNAGHEIVVQFNAYTLRDMCVGHAIVSMRKRGTKTLPVHTFSYVAADTACRTNDGARALAADAAFSGVKDLMSNLDSYKFDK